MESTLNLGEVVSISKGRKHSSVFDKPNGKTRRYIQIEDLRNDFNLKYTDESGVDVNPRDVIIAWDGANAGTIGFNLDGFIGSTLARLRIENKDVDSIFLGWLLRGNFQHLRSNCTGATVPHISRDILEKIPVPIFSRKEQQKIANILEGADTARQKRRQANLLTEQFLQSTFWEMFGDPVRNEKGWKIIELADVLGNIDSGWSPVCEDYPRESKTDWGILKLGSVSYRKFNPTENKALPSKLKGDESIEVRRGDLLFSRKNTRDLVGATVLVRDCPPRLMMSDTIFRLNHKNKVIDGNYLWYLFNENNFRRCIQALATGSSGSMPNISKEKLRKLNIPFPPFMLQQKFASLVDRVEKLREKQMESEKELENLFGALMQKYFS